MLSVLCKPFTSVFWEAFINSPPRSSFLHQELCRQHTIQQGHFFCWPDNSICYANHSVLQVEEVTSSQSSSFIIPLSNPLNLSLFLGVFTALPFQIWRTLASQLWFTHRKIPTVWKAYFAILVPLKKSCITSWHKLTVKIIVSCYWTWSGLFPLCLTPL